MFGLMGPCLSLDTACSSYLVALHLASTGLMRSECTGAFVEAAGLLGPTLNNAFASHGMLSMRG